MKNGQFGAKIKIHKNMRKTTLQPHYSCSMQKSDQKTSESSKNDEFFQSGKIGHGQFRAKIKTHKNMRKTTLQPHYSCSMQENGSKNKAIFEK